MAQFEFITLKGGQTVSTVNVRKVVGNGGVNLREDVLLIQALFKFIAEHLGPHAIFGSQSGYEVPEITGVMDAATYSAIGEFQIRNLRNLLMKTFDGRIHPASYKNREIQLQGKPLMSITYLHLVAQDASVMGGMGGDYTQDLARMNGELAMYLDRSILAL